MQKLCFFTLLFTVSLYCLHVLDESFFKKAKFILISLFIIINSFFMFSLSRSDNPTLVTLYYGVFAALMVLPSVISLVVNRRENEPS